MVPQTLAASVFVCTSGACASFTLPDGADISTTETTMCAAFRDALADQFSLDLSTVTLTKCKIDFTTGRLLAEETVVHTKRALADQAAFLCVSKVAATTCLLSISDRLCAGPVIAYRWTG
jgi:hypothetical protein